MFDITQFRAVDLHKVFLRDPDGKLIKNQDGENIAVEIHAKGSKAWNEANLDFVQRLAKLKADHGDFDKIPADEAKATKSDFWAALTSGLIGFTYGELKGAAAIKAFYSDDKLAHFHEQLDKEMGKWRVAGKKA